MGHDLQGGDAIWRPRFGRCECGVQRNPEQIVTRALGMAHVARMSTSCWKDSAGQLGLYRLTPPPGQFACAFFEALTLGCRSLNNLGAYMKELPVTRLICRSGGGAGTGCEDDKTPTLGSWVLKSKLTGSPLGDSSSDRNE